MYIVYIYISIYKSPIPRPADLGKPNDRGSGSAATFPPKVTYALVKADLRPNISPTGGGVPYAHALVVKPKSCNFCDPKILEGE